MIEVGDYVRSKTGYIGKVENINDFRPPEAKICVDFNVSDLIFLGETDIVKHSKNIIDLIEVGDYVNGYKILGIRTRNNNIEILTSTENAYNCWFVFEEQDIKSIVTKEQFKNMEYKIKEDK